MLEGSVASNATSFGTRAVTLWRFSRPHTVIGTTLSAMGLYAMVCSLQGFRIDTLWSLLLAILIGVVGNVYIVGINQVEDVAIDRINKPYLPIAAGRLSVRGGLAISVLMGIAGLAIALSQTLVLFGFVTAGLVIATLYSIPPFRLKRFPFWAALCIASVRGPIVNLAGYTYFDAVVGGASGAVPACVWVLALFVFGFSFAIAWYKDIPDLEGDRHHAIRTLTVRLGPRAVFRQGLALLTFCYLALICAAFMGIPHVHTGVLVASHGACLVALWVRASRVQPESKTAITSFYTFIWRLFYVEYVIYPASVVAAAWPALRAAL